MLPIIIGIRSVGFKTTIVVHLTHAGRESLLLGLHGDVHRTSGRAGCHRPTTRGKKGRRSSAGRERFAGKTETTSARRSSEPETRRRGGLGPDSVVKDSVCTSLTTVVRMVGDFHTNALDDLLFLGHRCIL